MMPPTQRRSNVERPDRAAADDDAGRGAVVGHGVEYFARVLQPRVDDFDRRHDVFGGAQHVGQADAGAAQRLAEDEGELDLDPRQAIILMRNTGAVGDHHIVEEVAVVRLFDLRGALHRFRGQPDFVADQSGAGRDFAVGDFGGDRVGVFHGDAGPGLGELNRLFALLLGGEKDIGGFVAVGGGHHGDKAPSGHAADLAHLAGSKARRRRRGFIGRRRAGRPSRPDNRRRFASVPTSTANQRISPPCAHRAAVRY